MRRTDNARFGSPVPVSPFDLVSRRPRTFRAEKPGFPLSSRNDSMKMSLQCQPLRLFVSTHRGCKSLKPRFVMVDVAEEMRGRQSVITGVWARERVITDVEEALCATSHTVSCGRFSIYSFRVLEPWCGTFHSAFSQSGLRSSPLTSQSAAT